ncbi:MAG: hypothetical protein WCO24_03240, partial [Actinomycetes bacterium]
MISQRSFATNTAERLVSRIYSLACVVSGSEALFHAWLQRGLMNPQSALATMAFGFVVIAMVVSAWQTGDARVWYKVHAVLVLILILTWRFQLSGSWPLQEQPWLWWAVGNAAISAGIGFSGLLGTAFQIFLPGMWVLLATSSTGGSQSIARSLEDAAYVFLLSASLSAIVWVLRNRARLVDSIHLKTVTALAEKNRADAIEQERSAAEALVHNQVLSALETALEAESNSDWNQAAAAAKEAEESIRERLSFGDLALPKAPLQTWAQNLKQTISSHYPGVLVETIAVEGLWIPNDIALALTESTMQAVDNSVRHAGPRANTRLKIEGLHAGVKVLVADNGRGFRLNRDSRGQVGIQRSIIERCKSVGVKPHLDTKPGAGCRVI